MVDIGTLITSMPGIRGGRPCVVGTGTSVQRISILYNQGLSAEQIATELPHIEPKYVFAALAFYFANRDAIERQIDEDQRESFRLAEEDRLRRLGS